MSVIFLFVFGYGLCSDYMLNLGIDLGMGCISRKISVSPSIPLVEILMITNQGY